LFILFGFFKSNAQTYNYSYTDPCTGNIKTIIVPINGSVTVGYYGFVENFTQQQFTDGTFETWANQVFSQYDGSPCAEIVGLGGQINITQDVTLNTVGLLNSLSALMDLSNGATDFLSGSLTAASNSSNTNNAGGNKKNGNRSQNGSGNNTVNNNNGTATNNNNSTTNNNQIQNNGTSNTNEGSTTTSGTNETSSNNGGNGTTNQNGGTQNPTPAGGTTTEGGSNENGSQQAVTPINQNQNGNENNNNPNSSSNVGNTGNAGSNGNVEGSNQQEVTPNGSTSDPNSNGGNGGTGSNVGNNGGNPPNGEETTTQTEEQGGGQTNITQGATKTVNQNKEGGKPTVIASSDFVGFNFQNSEVRTGLKLTGGYHNMRWDGETARGGLIDYVSAQQGPNLTGYHAWINKRSVNLLSGTLSVGFEGRGSIYGTIAGGQMLSFPKIKSLKVIYMGTVSYGQVYKTEFLGTAVIAGGMYDLRFGKRIDMKLMGLFVYSPYISYYNDLLLKSPYVVIPSLGTNINITKRFKFNINAGGAWAIKENALNYTVTCGARLLVGQ
jgi:hypothetical protein